MSDTADVPPGEPGEDRQDEPRPQPFHGPKQPPGEVDGPPGPEPTRFGDWEKGGRCSDF
jgi:hypothetical protein